MAKATPLVPENRIWSGSGSFGREIIAEQPGVARPTPLPRRPKGQWFLGFLVLAVAGGAGFAIWDTFFRYEAFGTVEGRLVEVPPPQEGVVRYRHVREGDSVEQGAALLTIENIDLNHELSQIDDELRIAQADVEAEVARLKWQAAFNMDNTQGSVVYYHELLGRLLQAQSREDDLRVQLRRIETLHSGKAASEDERDQLRYRLEGQQKLVAKLHEAVAELKIRADQAAELWQGQADLAAGLHEGGIAQLKPNLAKIEALRARKERLQRRIDDLTIRAPTAGLVTKFHRFPGEFCKAGEPLLTLLEEGSLEIVLYVPQKSSRSLDMGAQTDILVDPYAQAVRCTVVRLGQEYEPAPDQIASRYRKNEKLLPVHLRPDGEAARWMALRVGEVAKLNRQTPALFGGGSP